VALVAWFLFAGSVPVAVAAEASLSVEQGFSMTLMPAGDDASTWLLKRQGVREVTMRLVALSGEQAQTCATITQSWKTGPKDKPSAAGEILLLFKRQTDAQIIPSLGFNSRSGAGKFEGSVVTVKGKRLGAVRAAERALRPKEEHLLALAVFADQDGEKQFRDSRKDFASFSAAMKALKTPQDVKTWAKKHPKVTVLILTVSWLPAE
jgi:hypothetical protein